MSLFYLKILNSSSMFMALSPHYFSASSIHRTSMIYSFNPFLCPFYLFLLLTPLTIHLSSPIYSSQPELLCSPNKPQKFQILYLYIICLLIKCNYFYCNIKNINNIHSFLTPSAMTSSQLTFFSISFFSFNSDVSKSLSPIFLIFM